MTVRACVYTALIGHYEPLNEQPVARGSDLDFVCLTDDETLTSDTWRVVRVDPAWPTDHVRSARAFKILGHPSVAGYERTIWMDNSVVLHEDPVFLLDAVEGPPLAMIDHWDHRDLLDEFRAVLALGYDDPRRVHEQLHTYSLERPDLLEERPFATTVTVRRRTPGVDQAMRLWMDQVLRFSRRDQLSINYVLALTGLAAGRVDADLRAAGWASWPHVAGRCREAGFRAPGSLAGLPPAVAAEMAHRDGSQAERIAELERLVAAREAEIRDLRASHSWRLTRVLREGADVLRAARGARPGVDRPGGEATREVEPSGATSRRAVASASP